MKNRVFQEGEKLAHIPAEFSRAPEDVVEDLWEVLDFKREVEGEPECGNSFVSVSTNGT